MALPAAWPVQNVDIIKRSWGWFVQTARIGNDQSDDVGSGVVNGCGPSVPKLGVESCNAKSSYDAVSYPDEAGYPEEDVVFALEDGDVTGLLAYAAERRGEDLRQHRDKQ